MKKVYELNDVVIPGAVESEDGGMALIFDEYNSSESVGDGCLFVRLQSWDENKVHPLMHELFGKTIRITVEVED